MGKDLQVVSEVVEQRSFGVSTCIDGCGDEQHLILRWTAVAAMPITQKTVIEQR
jgi:hypothetical protein